MQCINMTLCLNTLFHVCSLLKSNTVYIFSRIFTLISAKTAMEFGSWFPMMSWFTPGSLFVLVNLMIGIIYLTVTARSRNNSPGQLARAHSYSSFSLLDRVGSINNGPDDPTGLISQPSLLYRLRSLGSSQNPATKTAIEREGHGGDRDGEDRQAKVTTENKTTSRECVLEDCVDEKADDFINRFRQQLRLQRLDSLKRLIGGT